MSEITRLDFFMGLAMLGALTGGEFKMKSDTDIAEFAMIMGLLMEREVKKFRVEHPHA